MGSSWGYGMISPLNVFRFALALALSPVVLSLGRAIRLPRAAKQAFAFGFIALVIAFGMQLVGPVIPAIKLGAVLGDTNYVFRFFRHVMFGVGGFGFAWAAWVVRAHYTAPSGVAS
jgi:hypothetical protein